VFLRCVLQLLVTVNVVPSSPILVTSVFNWLLPSRDCIPPTTSTYNLWRSLFGQPQDVDNVKDNFLYRSTWAASYVLVEAWTRQVLHLLVTEGRGPSSSLRVTRRLWDGLFVIRRPTSIVSRKVLWMIVCSCHSPSMSSQVICLFLRMCFIL
jgi:hypothetical protein